MHFPRLKKNYLNTFPAVHLKKMDAWDYAWVLSSELLVVILVVTVAGFNLFFFRENKPINDQSLANTFLSYHPNSNQKLYIQTASTKTQVIQKDNPLVSQALASEQLPETTTEQTNTSEPEIVQNDNTLVAQNPDSITQLLKRQVKVYVTKEDDTLGSIGRQFGISIDTIKWANNLPNNTIKPNWYLLIPPQDGLIIEAGPNTTLPDIVNKYKGNMEDIIAYNGLENEQDIAEGDYIFCKDCIIPVVNTIASVTNTIERQIGIADAAIISEAGHIFPKGYCTWYVAQHVKITFGGNANRWLANAKAAGYTTTNTPAVGYVVATNDDARYGHVALVTGVTSTHITVSEMNYVKFNTVSTRSIPIDSSSIKGYIIPKY